jgi:hypothetical protein
MLTTQGRSMTDAIPRIGGSEVAYYRGRPERGGLKADQPARAKDRALEHRRPTKAVFDLTPDKLILQEAIRESF